MTFSSLYLHRNEQYNYIPYSWDDKLLYMSLYGKTHDDKFILGNTQTLTIFIFFQTATSIFVLLHCQDVNNVLNIITRPVPNLMPQSQTYMAAVKWKPFRPPLLKNKRYIVLDRLRMFYETFENPVYILVWDIRLLFILRHSVSIWQHEYVSG